MIKKLQRVSAFLKIFFKNNKFILINSPLQLINLAEYYKKKKKLDTKLPVLIGFTNTISISQIKYLNYYYFNFKNIFFLSSLFNLKIFHYIFFIRKRMSQFKFCIIGDLNYYLFNEFYKNTEKNIILDDGTGSLKVKNILPSKNTTLFTIFKNLKINKKIKYLENNFEKLKSMKKKQKIDKKKIYIIGSASIEREFIRVDDFDIIINSILKKYKNKKIFYIPHRYESPFKNLKNFKRIIIKKYNHPIELALIKEKQLPYEILGFYTTALFSLNKIFSRKIKIYNIEHKLDSLNNNSDRSKFRKIKRQFSIHKINKFEYIKK